MTELVITLGTNIGTDTNWDKGVIATIIGGIHNKELNARYKKSQIRRLNRFIAMEELNPLIGPTMLFGSMETHPLQAPYNYDFFFGDIP